MFIAAGTAKTRENPTWLSHSWLSLQKQHLKIISLVKIIWPGVIKGWGKWCSGWGSILDSPQVEHVAFTVMPGSLHFPSPAIYRYKSHSNNKLIALSLLGSQWTTPGLCNFNVAGSACYVGHTLQREGNSPSWTPTLGMQAALMACGSPGPPLPHNTRRGGCRGPMTAC